MSADQYTIDALRGFARRLMQCWPDHDVDGGTLQDAAVEFGLLQPTIRHEACGDGCRCLDYYTMDDWADGVTCYRATPLLTGEDAAT